MEEASFDTSSFLICIPPQGHSIAHHDAPDGVHNKMCDRLLPYSARTCAKEACIASQL